MPTLLRPLWAAALLLTAGAGQPLYSAVELSEPDTSEPGFPLVVGRRAASIVLPLHAAEVVKTAAHELAEDIAAVSGVKPPVVEAGQAAPAGPAIQVLFAPELAGRWEAFRLSAQPGVLTVAGADQRGLAFGLYELSRRIGVSPWAWWADVPVTKRPELRLTVGEEKTEQPAVKYRGIFLNDEDWGLQPWAAKTFEPEVGNLGPKTYARIFGLLLRLRANTIWPAMHDCTQPFHTVPGNAAMADKYGIVVGSSHAEPILRSNVREWKLPKNDFNYLTHRPELLSYWEERVKERVNGDSLFTIGLRGLHDSPMLGPKTTEERRTTLEQVFADQRALLAKYLGHGDASRVGQVFVPYKEVLEIYQSGLKVPEDVPIMWPDDNYGYIRRFATEAERQRPGGLGVYYHASYLGAPLAWLWIDAMPPALIWAEMMRAYEQGARSVWILNVGDLKNTERSMEFFLELAWHADRTSPEAPRQFLEATARRDFGPEHATAIADLLARMQALNVARRVEFLQWFPSRKPYRPTELNEAEIHQRLEACAALRRESEALAARLPAPARDAFFELVGYPVAITAAANERYFHSELARADEARGRSPEGNRAAAEAAQKAITAATARYQNEVAGGKWRLVVTENGLSPRDWQGFQPDRAATLPVPSEENVCPPAPPEAGPLVRAEGAHPGDFVERGKVVSMEAGHFTGQREGAGGAGWRALPGLGRTGAAVTVLPSTAQLRGTEVPTLEYRFHVSSGGPAKLDVRLLPTHPLVTDQGLRVAVAVDEAAPLPLKVTRGFNPKTAEWEGRVLANATTISTSLAAPLTPGWHTLRLVAVDAGVVVDKLVLHFGDLPLSYDGPTETRLP